MFALNIFLIFSNDYRDTRFKESISLQEQVAEISSLFRTRLCLLKSNFPKKQNGDSFNILLILNSQPQNVIDLPGYITMRRDSSYTGFKIIEGKFLSSFYARTFMK